MSLKTTYCNKCREHKDRNSLKSYSMKEDLQGNLTIYYTCMDCGTNHTVTLFNTDAPKKNLGAGNLKIKRGVCRVYKR